MTTADVLPLSPVELLTTTRSVRKRLDLSRPVPRELITRCLDIATQAPIGSNLQGWQFLIVDEPDQRAVIADAYRRSHEQYLPLRRRPVGNEAEDAPERLRGSVDFLAEHLAEVPTLLVPLQRGRLTADATNHQAASFYGSSLPAVWSFMLAARAHRLGTSYTTMHLRYEHDVAAALGIPYDKYTQTGLVAVGYFTGESFKRARRHPIAELVHWNRW